MAAAVFQRNWQVFALVVIAQLCDLATFYMGVARVGSGAEQNVLVRYLYKSFGMAGPLVLKLFTLATILPLLWLVASRWQGRVLSAATMCIGIAMVGVYGNLVHGILR